MSKLLRHLIFGAFCVSEALLLSASPVDKSSHDPFDISNAGVDGPYVFYKGSDIVIKSVALKDTTPYLKSETYRSRYSFNLHCIVSETGDKFSFPLHEFPEQEPETYPAAAKVLALSDIEGNFRALKTMLIGAKVMDKDFNWTYGNGHLVLNGDFFDRGLNVTECLWLLYKLEAEATAANGKVHFILGNHEILNLQGNNQYVRRKYIENLKILKESYDDCYGEQSELGRWLRSKNAIEKIGEYAFCHGGISWDLVSRQLSISDINRITRKNIGKPIAAMDELSKAVFNEKTGIFWYRGLARNQVSVAQTREMLNLMDIRRLVIGHTLQSDLTALYGGRVICIDIYHEENLRQGFMKTLFIEDGYCYSLDSKGHKSPEFSIYFGKKAMNE